MFSVQQLVSCVPNPRQCGGKGGCKGATCDLALDYVMKKGLRRASEFPYEERDDLACPSGAEVNAKSEPSSAFQVSMRGSGKGDIGEVGDTSETTGLSLGLLGFSELPENKLEPLMRALYEVGPAKVSISIPEGFHQYDKGVMDGCPKNSIVTHGAVLIGYGEDSKLGVNYWKLQNSWGPDWGEAGRFRFTRLSKQHEENDSCGWDAHPEKGNGCIGGPSRIRVCGTCAILSNAVIPHFQGLNVGGVKRHDF
jgi:cathepsin L